MQKSAAWSGPANCSLGKDGPRDAVERAVLPRLTKQVRRTLAQYAKSGRFQQKGGRELQPRKNAAGRNKNRPKRKASVVSLKFAEQFDESTRTPKKPSGAKALRFCGLYGATKVAP